MPTHVQGMHRDGLMLGHLFHQEIQGLEVGKCWIPEGLETRTGEVHSKYSLLESKE